jgi:hypothetical protein
MLTSVRLLLRLMAVGCFLIAPVFYLLLAHDNHLTCDRATGSCVLEEKRPLRDPHVQTFAIADVLDANCQSDAWMASPQAAAILKQARRPFNASQSGIWVSGPSGEDIPRFRPVLLTRGGIFPVTPDYAKDCMERGAITDVLEGRSTHGEMDLGRGWGGLVAMLLPVGTGIALLAWAGRLGKGPAYGAVSAPS